MKNTEQILDLIIKNVYINLEKGDYKSLNESIIMYQETIASNSKHIDSIHYKYFTELNKTLSESVIVNQLKMGQNKNVRLLLNSVNNIESLLNVYKGKLIYKESANDLLESKDLNITALLNDNIAKEMLDYSIKHSILILTNNENNRRIGKTSELIKMANELNCTLIVDSYLSKKYCKQLFDEIGVQCNIIVGHDKDLIRGIYCKNKKFLVDELVKKEVIDSLMTSGNQLIGGFANYNRF